jgi:hypothetical protein
MFDSGMGVALLSFSTSSLSTMAGKGVKDDFSVGV